MTLFLKEERNLMSKPDDGEQEDRYLVMAKKLHEVRAEMHKGILDKGKFETALAFLDHIIVYLGQCSISESRKE